MRGILLAAALVCGLLAAPAAGQSEPLPPEAQALVEQLSPRSGAIPIPEARATLDLGERYMFYGAADARRILVEVWGNPPEQADGVLGLVMPAGSTPFSDTWGAVVTYEETGHVDDDDARDADYDALMAEMQEAAIAANEERRAAGYGAVNVVGWAQAPRYDSVNHSVVWAREIAFEGDGVNALNYDLRTLGRTGVLSINLITSMPELGEMREVAQDFTQIAAFDPGASYDDFDSSTDEAAGYGIAGLVAGGAGLAVAKKVGVLAVLLKFIKPILIGLMVLLGAFGGRIKRLFGKREEEVEWEEAAPPPPTDDTIR
jgi:uncharacterized membrane-anchored protein